MPNPLMMTAKSNCFARFFRRAGWQQRITIEKGSIKHVVVCQDIPTDVGGIEAGEWKITHEFFYPGTNKWTVGVKGEIFDDNEYSTQAGFDDGINEGDNDYNDANVWFVYKEKF